MAEIITLDNYEARMPKWHPQASSHLYALVDMGRSVFLFLFAFSLSYSSLTSPPPNPHPFLRTRHQFPQGDKLLTRHHGIRSLTYCLFCCFGIRFSISDLLLLCVLFFLCF